MSSRARPPAKRLRGAPAAAAPTGSCSRESDRHAVSQVRLGQDLDGMGGVAVVVTDTAAAPALTRMLYSVPDVAGLLGDAGPDPVAIAA